MQSGSMLDIGPCSKGHAMGRVSVFAICSCIIWGGLAESAQSTTRQARACLAWDRELARMLERSELFGLHTADLRQGIRAEAFKLRERCVRDISTASLNRYVLFMKILHDDEADEVEIFSDEQLSGD